MSKQLKMISKLHKCKILCKILKIKMKMNKAITINKKMKTNLILKMWNI